MFRCFHRNVYGFVRVLAFIVFWYLVFCWFCCCFFSLHWLFLYRCYLVLIVVDLVSETIDLFAVVVLCCGCCVPSCWYWCSVCLVMVWLVAFLVSWGVWWCRSSVLYVIWVDVLFFCGWLRCLCCFHTLYSRFRGRRFFFYCPFLCCSFPDYVAGCCPVLLLLLFA